MIRIVPETGSTNSDLLAALRAGEAVLEGDWLVADRQTSGRGRMGREWFDAGGNFMGSTVVHLRAGDPPRDTLALMAGLALHEALAWHMPKGGALTLKWPNDLMAGNAKVAGILLEGQGEAVVIGIGVNLTSAPDVPGRKTAALSSFVTPPSRNIFAEDLARAMASELERWRGGGLGPVLRRWQALAHPLGTKLTVLEPGREPTSGTYAGLSEEGNLQLRLADGALRVIQAGDVIAEEEAGQ